MKIGILTYHSSHNYGAFLQAYALCKAIKENTGNDTEIINFSMEKAEEQNRRISKSHGHNFRNKRFLQKRYQMFEISSERYHTLSGMRFVSDNPAAFAEWVNGRYDAIVVGSDEIWKLDGYRGFPTSYWLPGVTGCKKLSYAASSRNELTDISDVMKEQLRDFLRSFDYIGVRDEVTRTLIEYVAGQGTPVHLNCDPTFVYDFHTSKEVGRQLIREKFGVTGEKKCIALMMDDRKLANAIIDTFGKQFDFISLYCRHPGSKGCAVLDPFEWMEAIAGADGLITGFFHGMVFALKNNTPFLSFENRRISGKEFSKAYDLLKRNGLEHHFFMLGDFQEQTFREVGSFLADVISGKAENDFRSVCEAEKKRFSSFAEQFPDVRPKHILIRNQEDCCGCCACEAVCPTKSIKMEKNDEGFWYPVVDKNTCIQCGLCRKECTFTPDWGGLKDSVADLPLNVLGAKHKSEVIRRASRSGGIFTALSDYILSLGGSIYGVALNSDFLAEHRRAVTKQERDLFRGSKYIQSDMSNVYTQIRDDLRNGKAVLFSGTPCQVAAVQKAMEEETCERLFLVDIVCHGVPSPKVWRDYLDYLEKKHHGPVTDVDFRNKKFGWAAHKESVIIDGAEYDQEDFKDLFYAHVILRPSCYACKFKCISRPGDITIADFWGIDNAIPGFNDDKGVSLVLINTEKGIQLFDAGKEDVVWKEARLENSMQNSLRMCYQKPAGRDIFWEKYKNSGIAGVISKGKQNRRYRRFSQQYRRGKRFASKVLKRLWWTIR